MAHPTPKPPRQKTRLSPQRVFFSHPTRAGQALAELTICLLIFIALILAITTLTRLSLRQLHLRRDVRAEAGQAALTRATQGWVNPTLPPEERSHPMHRVNAYTRLDTYAPALTSHLPTSHYTLASRDLPEAELGLETTTREEILPLDTGFTHLLYPKGTIKLRESATFPATTGLHN